MKHIKLFENFDKNSLENELNKYNIKNYTINKDGTIDVDGSVNLSRKNLKHIPFKFGQVTGAFACSYNILNSLDGCPYYVGHNFGCSGNKLINLIGGPEEVGGDYDCYDNRLTSLEGIAAEIGGSLYCRDNELIDLNISSNIKGDINCKFNEMDPSNYQFYGEVGGKIFI